MDGKNTFSAKYQQEPGVSGPLKVGNSLVDAFTLQYYEGFPMDQVASGEIKSDQQWKVLSKLKNGYQTACLPHRKWRAMLRNRWSVISTKPGHRSHQCTENHGVSWARLNIASLLTALDFKPYQLHDQNERTPIGGKIVFQHWHDSKANRDLMKIEYVPECRTVT